MSPRKPKAKPFVKSADTTVTVQESIESIKQLVRRHNAQGFGVMEDYKTGRSIVQFTLLDENGSHIPISIPIDIGRVYKLMYSHPNDPKRHDESVKEARKGQAERTAWRQLYLIIDATLTAHALGVMSIGDAFLAHTMIVHDNGQSERMGDFVQRTGGALAPGVRALLPSSTSSAEPK